MKLRSSGFDDALNALAFELEQRGWWRIRRGLMVVYGWEIRLVLAAIRTLARRGEMAG